jgi:hypothetical protein
MYRHVVPVRLGTIFFNDLAAFGRLFHVASGYSEM